MTASKRKYINSLIIIAAIIVGVLTIDLVLKAVTDGVRYLELIPNFLYVDSYHNPVAAFSFSFGIDPKIFIWIVIPLTFLVVGGILFYLVWAKEKHVLLTVSLSLIASGAAGNLIDRIFMPEHYVRDFISIKYFGLEIFGSTHFAVFNIADAALVCGCIVLVIWAIIFLISGKKLRPMTPVPVTETSGACNLETPQPVPSRRPEGDDGDENSGDDKSPDPNENSRTGANKGELDGKAERET